MKRTFCIAFAGLILPALLLGCASVVSTSKTLEGLGAGLAYYMPRKDFITTVVQTGGKITHVTLATTEAYPDLAEAFVLTNATNLIGKNQADLSIGTNGLLKSSKAVTTSGVSDALRNLAESLGALHGMKADQPPSIPACADGTHAFISKGAEEIQACGLKVKIQRLNATLPPGANLAKDSTQHSGIFYRQAEPYLMTASGALNVSVIVFSPNQAPTRYLPISRTLFANNESNIEFTDGMPTKFNETREGELVAVFKLPATVIAAYFTAIGTVFSSFKDNNDKEAGQLAAEIKLELAKKKYDACLTAIQAKDSALVTALECGK